MTMRSSKLKRHLLYILSLTHKGLTPLDLFNRLSFKDKYKTKEAGRCTLLNSLKSLERDGLTKRTDVEVVGRVYSFWEITDLGEHMVEGRERELIPRASSDEKDRLSDPTHSPPLNILQTEGDRGGKGH